MRSVTSIIIFSLSLSRLAIGESHIPLFERLVGAGHIAPGSSNQTDATYQGDNRNFGKACRLAETESSTCGDYFDGRVDHALFCSPVGICAGRGAICGTDAACNTGTSSFNLVLLHFPPPLSQLTLSARRRTEMQRLVEPLRPFGRIHRQFSPETIGQPSKSSALCLSAYLRSMSNVGW